MPITNTQKEEIKNQAKKIIDKLISMEKERFNEDELVTEIKKEWRVNILEDRLKELKSKEEEINSMIDDIKDRIKKICGYKYGSQKYGEILKEEINKRIKIKTSFIDDLDELRNKIIRNISFSKNEDMLRKAWVEFEEEITYIENKINIERAKSNE